MIHIASQGKQATVKGANYERKIAKKLTEGFGVEFHRTAYSGATSNGASLAGIQSFTGDLFTTDERFNFSFELKTHEKFRLKDIFTNNKIFTNFLAQNVADALDYSETAQMTRHLDGKYFMSVKLTGMNMKSTVLTEKGIYKAIFHSHKKEAEDFQDWVLDVISELRKSTQLEGFEIFKMLDKDYQKKAMSNLKKNTPEVRQYDYINANRTANRVVSDMYGHTKGKALSKSEMSPEMLLARQSILDDSANLYSAKRNFHLDISVRDALNEKYNKKEEA